MKTAKPKAVSRPSLQGRRPSGARWRVLSALVLCAGLASGAVARAEEWLGPNAGPSAAPGRRIVVVAENMRNGGISGLVDGMQEAAGVLGWHLEILDAAGDPNRLSAALKTAVSADPGDGAGPADGLVLAGMDAVRNMPDFGASVEASRLPVVGWHVGPQPGPVASTPVAVNITTDPAVVARLAAEQVINRSTGHAGVVILTDYQYAIAVSKARVMANRIRGCERCTLLEVIDLPIAETASRMDAEVERLRSLYGDQLTHILAINDLYFDDATGELQREGVPLDRMSLISAGDGSPSARDRIRRGYYQTATAAEPLPLQAWQLLDELNRLMAHQPVSGFIASPILITREQPAPLDGVDFRRIYREIWGR